MVISLVCRASESVRSGKLERANTRVQPNGEDPTECHADSEIIPSRNLTMQGESLGEDKKGVDRIERWPLVWPGRHQRW